jgi:hypothetical protein
MAVLTCRKHGRLSCRFYDILEGGLPKRALKESRVTSVDDGGHPRTQSLLSQEEII